MNQTIFKPALLALAAGAASTWGATARADDPNIQGPSAVVRVLHAVADGPKVDVYIDGVKKLNDYEFGRHIEVHSRSGWLPHL
jgi:hypothetical protein